MSYLFTLANQMPVQSNGRPYGGARLYFFRAGTTTHQEVFTTQDLDVAHDQPVEADADGKFPAIYINPIADYDYRYQLKTSADVLIDDQDDYPRTGLVAGTGIRYARTAAEIAASVTPVNYYEPPGQIERYQTYVNSSTDMSTGVQAAFDLCATHVATFFPGRTYRCNSDLDFPASHGLRVQGNGATIDSFGSAASISFNLVSSTTYPASCRFSNLYINVNGGTSRTGIIVRTSQSIYDNVNIVLKSDAVSAKAFTLVGDESNGTGPYYNSFLDCGTSHTRADQLPVFFSAAATLYRAPNANSFIGGRYSGSAAATVFTVRGSGNNFNNVTMDGLMLTAYSFLADTAVNCVQNIVNGGYIENATNAYTFGADTLSNMVIGGAVSSVTNLWTDSGTTNVRITGGDPSMIPSGIIRVPGISSTTTKANNLCGTITISGTNTFGSVSFGTSEANTSYRVVALVTAQTGTPAAGATRVCIDSKAVSGFVVVLEAAPGVGNSVTVEWILVR